MYKLKKHVGSNNFSAQFNMIISHYKKLVITFRRVSEVFYKVCALVKYWGTPLWKGSGVKPCDKKGFSAFQRTTMSAQDTQLYTIWFIFFLKNQIKHSKICSKQLLKKKTKTSFSRQIIAYCRSKELQREHSAILWTFIKLPFVNNIGFVSIFK